MGRLWLQGYSYREIATMIQESAKTQAQLRGAEKTSYVTVAEDVKAMREEWVQALGSDMGQRRADALARMNEVRRKTWEEYRVATPSQRPQLLANLASLEERQAKIEGTLAPTQLTGAGGTPLANPNVIFQMPDGTVFVPPRNGHKVNAGDNGH